MHKLGIYVDEVLHLDGLRMTPVSDMELVVVSKCPCCLCTLDTFALLSADREEDSDRIRIGRCSGCGYFGYIDKPSKDWISTFYNEVWDVNTKNSIDTIKPFSPSVIIDIAKELNIGLSESIFDIGAGNGQILRQFKDAGFANLFGSEHSPHRAALASEYADADVRHEPFTLGSVAAWQNGTNYRFMYSKSVMEHVYDPNEIFETASILQSDGDYLVILVPDTDKESVINISFFVPHLHSFSKQSLVKLASRYQYHVHEVREHGTGIILIAQKRVSVTTVIPEYQFSSIETLIERWLVEFEYAHLSTHPKVYWCNTRDSRMHGVLSFAGIQAIELFFVLLLRVLTKYAPKKILLIILRVVLGIPRRHHMLILRRADDIIDTIPVVIQMKKLFLTYK